MSEYIHLIGVEQVQSAAHRMFDAAERMNSAAGSIEWPMQQALNRFEEIVARFETAVEKLSAIQLPRAEGDDNGGK